MTPKQYYWRTPEELRCQHSPAQYKPLLCDECSADDAYKLYHHANTCYRQGEAIWWDSTWDIYERICRERWPEDGRFKQVGETR